MSLRRVTWQAAAWLCVFAVWFFATRRFHPTTGIALAATAVLVSASALAVYLNGLWLLPWLARRRQWLRYALSLTATVCALDLFAVLSIQAVYDWLWRPDPLRFGFWFNMASDAFIIALHLAAAQGVVLVARLLHRKRVAANH
ncbi:MAG TPA: hypothetical protein VGC89_03005 [Pyrinomonadaceae bacterium]|jgi:hypothetical protein